MQNVHAALFCTTKVDKRQKLTTKVLDITSLFEVDIEVVFILGVLTQYKVYNRPILRNWSSVLNVLKGQIRFEWLSRQFFHLS